MKTTSQDARLALALFCLLTFWFWLTASAHTYIADGETVFAVTESLAERGTFALTFIPGDTTPRALVEAADGRQYAITGPLQSILALPFYGVGRWASGYFAPAFRSYFTHFFVLLFNAPVHAATAALLYLFGVDLGFRRRTACFVALTYALATVGWPYARTFYAESLHAFWLVLAAWAIYRYAHTERWLWMAVTGLALGLGIATKYVMAVAGPAYVLYLALIWMQRHPGRERRRWTLRTLLAGGVPFALIIGMLLLFNIARFGGPLETGYTTSETRGTIDTWAATARPLVSLYGFLFSSGKGFFFFSPPAVLAIWGVAALLHRRREAAVLIFSIPLLYLIFYMTMTSAWHGGGNWGPRYLVCTTPFVLLPLGAYLERRALPRLLRLGSAVIFFVMGFWVQFSTVAVNYSTYLFSDVPADHQRYYPHYSPLGMQWQLWPRMVRTWQQYDHNARVSDETFYTLESGFYPIEVDALAPFGRWTQDLVQLYINAAPQQSLTVRLSYSRPRAADPEDASWPGLHLYYDHAPVTATRELVRENEHEVQWLETLTLPAAQVAIHPGTLAMTTTTWQPPGEERALGVFIAQVEVLSDGLLVAYREARLPAPLPINADIPWRWEAMRWFYDPANARPADLWAAYIWTVGVPWRQARAFILIYAGLVGIGLFISGIGFVNVTRQGLYP